MAKIKAVIFDLGSVVFDINWKKINEEMMKKFGINVLIRSCGNEKIQKYYDETLVGKREMKEVFNELKTDNVNLDEVVDFYKKLYKKYKRQNEGITELIDKLKMKNNLKIFCLTDTNKLHFQAHNEQNSLDEFDKIFTSFQLGIKKSDKEVFVKVLNEIRINPDELIFVDDNEKNVNNAQSLGINAIKFEDNNQLIRELKAFKINM